MFPTLKECPLFRGLDNEQLGELLGRSSYIVNKYETDALIASRDMAYSGLMIIVSGSIRGTINRADGKEYMVDTVAAGQLIAPAFLFGGYNRLPIDVRANEPTRVMTLHRGSLFEMMQDNMVVLSNFIDIISNRANYFSRKIYALTVLMLKEKVACYILGQAIHEDTLRIDSYAMASSLDITRESCMQTFTELEKKGVVKIEGDQLRIINYPALREIAGVH